MTRPTLAEIRYFQVHGKQPESLIKRRKAEEKAAKETTAEEPEKEANEPESNDQWPKEAGGGWWQLSNGKKIQNEDKAREAQAQLNGG